MGASTPQRRCPARNPPPSLGGDIDTRRSCSDSCSDSCSSVPALVRGARGGRPPARGARRACCRPPCHPVVRGARGGRHPARGATIDVSSVATGTVPTEHCGAEVACLLSPLFEIQLTSNMRSRPRRDTKNQGPVRSTGTALQDFDATGSVGLQDVAQPAIEITMPGHASPRVPAGAPEPLTHFV